MRGQEFVRLVAERHDAAGDLEQRGAGFGELGVPRLADQKLDAVGLLQLLDLDRERRLPDIEHARGRGEAAMSGDRMEGTQLAEHY
ncbi:hypothetical protein ACVWW1_001592 [Bradyrhizobium sp. JR3.5]